MKDNLKMAFGSILSNKMRSLLTMLGIIIGTAAVIAILAIGNGATDKMMTQLNEIVGTSLTVSVSDSKADPDDYVTLKDIERIKENIETVQYASPVLTRSGFAQTDKVSKPASISCGTPDLQYVGNIGKAKILYGRFFNESEYNNGDAVAVISQRLAEKLFNGRVNVVGETIKIGATGTKDTVKVVGVTESLFNNAGNQMDDEEMDRMLSMPQGADMAQMIYPVYIPLSYANQLFGEKMVINQVGVSATTIETIEEASNSVINLLERRHNNRGENIYVSSNMKSMADQMNEITGIMITFIAIVAAISLLVGGIGVMNIMLVSVTERTREIGIRKAIGATTRAIMSQFLTESIAISLLGGIIGMIFGFLGAWGLSNLTDSGFSISAGTVALVVAYSIAIGVFFGAYPARKAANLDPVDSLRYD